MKFGVFFLLQSPDMRDSATVYRRALEQMVYADELGFDSVWIAEHHFSNYGYCPNPLALAVKAAQMTRHVRVGTAVLVLPLWHPLRLAEEIAMADVLTEGRLEVGVARGYQSYEFDRLGLNIDESRERSDETLDVMLKALSADSFAHEGRFYSFPETTIFPKSVQEPHPPVWLAVASNESIESAVRRGLRCFTTSSARPVSSVQGAWEVFQRARRTMGRTDDVEFAVQQHVHVAATDQEARGRMEHSIWHYRQVNRLRTARERVERGFTYADPLEDEPSFDDLFKTHTISGSPETAREKLQRYQDAVGLTQLNCYFALGALDNETVKSSMRMFAEKVMPHFK